MALIKCPECGRENVSSSAKKCPGCGVNIQELLKSTEDDNSLQEQKEINDNEVVEVVPEDSSEGFNTAENETFVEKEPIEIERQGNDKEIIKETEQTYKESALNNELVDNTRGDNSIGVEKKTGDNGSYKKKTKKKIKLAYITLILGIISIPLLCAWGFGGCLAIPVIVISIVLLVSKTEDKAPTIIGLVCSCITILIISLILIFAIGETVKDSKEQSKIQSYINSGEYDLAYEAVNSSNLSEASKDGYKYDIYVAKGEYDSAAYIWLSKLQGKTDKASITNDELGKISSIYDNLSDEYKEQYNQLVQERDDAIERKEAEEAEKQARKEAEEAEKQAQKEAKEAEKQAQKEAKETEKQSQNDAEDTEKQIESANDASQNASNQSEKFIPTEADKVETSWYVPPKELGDGSEYRSIQIDSVVYQFPCPIMEFMKNGFTLMNPSDEKYKGGELFANGFYMNEKGKDQSEINSLDDIVRYNSDGYVALVKDDIIIDVYFENVDTSRNMALKYCQVPRIASINQLYDANVEPIHVLFPAKYGAKDPFYMTEDEMVKLQDSDYCYPIYKNIKLGPVDLELYELNVLKWIDGDRFFKQPTGGVNVRTIFLGP